MSGLLRGARMDGLLKPLLKTARTATRIVAASNADAKSKAEADDVCTGTDDQVKIQAAINSLPVSGGIVQLSEGTFFLTASIVIERDWVTLQGVGESEYVFYNERGRGLTQIYSGLSIGLLRVLPPAGAQRVGIMLKDIAFIGNDVNNGKAGIYLEEVDVCRLEDIRVEACQYGVQVIKGWAIFVTNSLFILNNIGFYIENGYEQGHHAFVNTHFSHNYSYGLWANNVKHCQVIGGMTINSPGSAEAAIYLEACWQWVFLGHQVYSWGGHGFRLGGHHNTLIGCASRGNKKHGYMVLGDYNRLIGCFALENDADETSSYDGVFICGNGNTVQSCVLGDNDRYNLYQEGVDVINNMIMGNHFEGTKQVAHLNLDNPTKQMVKHNFGYITENSGTATVASGSTTVVVNHGLAATPTRVLLTARLWSSANKAWVTGIGATQFTINVDADPGAGTAIFDWKAQVGEG